VPSINSMNKASMATAVARVKIRPIMSNIIVIKFLKAFNIVYWLLSRFRVMSLIR
jgi:hypothetical protein